MGKDPSVIRAEIEQTRERVGDEVDALSYKTDVAARVGDYVDDKKEAVKSKLTGAKDTVTAPLPDRRTIKRGASARARHRREQPARPGARRPRGRLPRRHAAAADPTRERADRRDVGPVIDAAKETASDAVDRGKQVAQEAVDAAVDTAKESAASRARN